MLSVSLKRIVARGAGEVAQQLRTLAAPPENLGAVTSTQQAAHNSLYLSVLGDWMPPSDFRGHQACMWSTDIWAGKTHTHTHRIKKRGEAGKNVQNPLPKHWSSTASRLPHTLQSV